MHKFKGSSYITIIWQNTACVYLLKQKSYVFLSKGKLRPLIRILGKYIKFRPNFAQKGAHEDIFFITYLI